MKFAVYLKIFGQIKKTKCWFGLYFKIKNGGFINIKTKAKISFLLGIVVAILAIIALVNIRNESNNAFAATVDAEQTENFIVSPDTENIPATYEFIPLNDTECSVRITNKSVATKAVIPWIAKIDGKDYKVIEVANNGFMSSTNLIRVSLPFTIKRVGNNAFANCAKLSLINLSNVTEIGNGAFMLCPQLSEIFIPESATKLGTYVFRNNNTQVRVRASAEGVDWASTWNKNNGIQEVDYEYKEFEPLVLEPIYNKLSRSNDLLGYNLADGQPRTDEFYTITSEDDAIRTDDDNIIIPAIFEKDQKQIIGIASYAFMGANFNQLIIDYSEIPLKIGNNAFMCVTGENITINRSIEFFDEEANADSESIFVESEIKSIILPNDLTTLPNSVFYSCKNLSNIFFTVPQEMSREAALNVIDNFKNDSEAGVVYLPSNSQITSIGSYAFSGTSSITQLHLDASIEYIGEGVLAGWNSSTQTVYVHNNNQNMDWHISWHTSLEDKDIKYDYYKLTFDPNGGKFVDSDEEKITRWVKINEPIGELPKVIKDECKFNCWIDESNNDYDESTKFHIEQDLVLKATWVPRTYTITFNPNGGTGGTTSVEAAFGDILPKGEAPKRYGYNFLGYFEEKDNPNSQRYYFPDMTSQHQWNIKEDKEIYAAWEAKAFTIKLYSGYGDNILYEEFKIDFNERLPVKNIPLRRGYDFTGYYTECQTDDNSNAGEQIYPSNMQTGINDVWAKEENGILYAHWQATQYTITYSIADMRSLPENYANPNPKTFTIKDIEESPLKINTVETNGYLINWTLDSINKDMLYDIIIYGTLTPLVYNIKYELNGGINNPGNPSKYTVEDRIELLEPTDSEERPFLCWKLNYMSIKVIENRYGDITLKATWADVVVYNITQDDVTITCSEDIRYVKVLLPEYAVHNCKINVSDPINDLYIKGHPNVEYNLSINIESDEIKFDQEFQVRLKDVIIKASATENVIFVTKGRMNRSQLHLYTYGIVKLYGGLGMMKSSNGFLPCKGAAAIVCDVLQIWAADDLYIQGGDGGFGGRLNGYKDGMDGGDAGFAVESRSPILKLNCGNITFAAGKAGNGGPGANGINPGSGGKGGKGSTAIIPNVYVIKADGVTNIVFIDSEDGKNGINGFKTPEPIRPNTANPNVSQN